MCPAYNSPHPRPSSEALCVSANQPDASETVHSQPLPDSACWETALPLKPSCHLTLAGIPRDTPPRLSPVTTARTAWNAKAEVSLPRALAEDNHTQGHSAHVTAWNSQGCCCEGLPLHSRFQGTMPGAPTSSKRPRASQPRGGRPEQYGGCPMLPRAGNASALLLRAPENGPRREHR